MIKLTKEEKLQKRREYRKKNLERFRQNDKDFYQRHKERLREYKKQKTKEYSEVMKKWKKETSDRNKSILYLGICEECGYKGTTHLHHIDKSTKSFTIGPKVNSNTNIDILMEERKKCIELCCSCHRKRHPEIMNKCRKKVKNISLNMEFKSIAEAARYFNIKYPHKISLCCKNKEMTCGGFKWEYIN